MKDFLNSFLIEPFSEGIIGVIIGLFMWLVVGFLVFLCFWGVDALFLPTQQGTGVVISKDYVPESEVLIDGVWHTIDEDFVLYIKVGDKVDDFSVSSENFEKINVNQKFNVVYSHGRIWETIYIDEISN